MKNILIILILNCWLYAQSDESLLSHYPNRSGNVWDYTNCVENLGILYPGLTFKSCSGDSMHPDGKSYQILQIDFYSMAGQQRPGALGTCCQKRILQRIDTTTFNVYQIDPYFNNNQPYLVDSLLANTGDIFTMFPGQSENILGLLDTSTQFLFGQNRLMRHLAIMNPIVGYEFRTAAGLGEFAWVSSGEGSPSYRQLDGAIIDGDTIGVVQRILEPGLAINRSQLEFNSQTESQMLSLINPGAGLTIIDSVIVNDESRFYSYPGYRSGYYGHRFFCRGPFLIFPRDSIQLQLFIQPELSEGDFTDTLRIFARGVNGTCLPSLLVPIYYHSSVYVDPIDDRSPTGFYLSQNFPNPFNPATVIRFNLPKSALVTLKIFNSLGIKVATLIQCHYEPGVYEINWSPDHLPPGVYFCQMKADQFMTTRKLVYLR